VSPTSTIADDTYDNTTGRKIVIIAGQAITSSWSSCGTLFGPASGSAATTFSDSTEAALVYTVTAAFGPGIAI
jgi:hypothetical protein